jgi:hypothetical protein
MIDMADTVSQNSVDQVVSKNSRTEYPIQKVTQTVTVGAAAGTLDTECALSGVVTQAYLIPGAALTISGSIKVYPKNTGLTTTPYPVNYTVPNPAIQTTAALAARIRVCDTLTLSWSGLTAGDTFTIIYFVDPNADTHYPAT